MTELVAFVMPSKVRIMTGEEFDALHIVEIPGSGMSHTRGRPTLYVEGLGMGVAYPVELSEGVRL